MECVICGKKANFIEEGIDPLWTPCFHEDQVQHGPACPECSGIFLKMDSNGEMELKKRYHGKINYKGGFLDQTSEKAIFLRIAMKRTMQSILN